MITKPKYSQNNNYAHFQKIVVLGENGVGKSSFISSIENFENSNNHEINNIDKINNNLSSKDPIGNYLLVEEIKKINVKINEFRTIHYNFYKINTDKFDLIKTNLDTLLFQVECIVFIYRNKETFDNIPKFINSINSLKMNYKNIPIFLVQNKIKNDEYNDLKEEQIGEKKVEEIIESMKKNNSNLIDKKIMEEDDYLQIFLDIDRNLNNQEEKTNINYNLVKFPLILIEKNILDDYKKIKLQISLLGESSTGKSEFIKYLNKLKLVKKVKNDYLISANIENKECIIQIKDTLGKQSKNNISKTSDGFLLFYDLTIEKSFNAIDDYIKIIKSNDKSNDKSSEIILLGNKVDDTKNRHVKKQYVMEFAAKREIKYYECSCKNGINIYEILNEISLMSFNGKENKIEDINSIEDNIGYSYACCFIS